MSKAVLMSIKSFYVFLIIAKLKGWNFPQNKTREARKNYPKDKDWDRKVFIYCSKDKKSFNKIPKEYQPYMKQYLGKIIGEFICDDIIFIGNIADYSWEHLRGNIHELHKVYVERDVCLTEQECINYGGKFLWHISNLKIYDQPKELNEFRKKMNCYQPGDEESIGCWEKCCIWQAEGLCTGKYTKITRPPQSWSYCETIGEQQ